MIRFGVFLGGLLLVAASSMLAQTGAPPANAQAQIAGMREEIRALDEIVRRLSVDLEQMARENRQLRERVEAAERSSAGRSRDFVTTTQLNQAVADLTRAYQSADAEQRREIVTQVTRQIEQLAKQSQSAIDAVARGSTARQSTTPAPAPNFGDDFPREGISYVVQRGDTLSSIAARNNSTVRDIQNANRIANPTALQVGQTLFIPQGRNE
jgi:LysM repeat protein